MPNMKLLIKMALRRLVDNLNRFILVLFFIFLIIAFFIRSFYIDLTKLILFIIFIYRLTSKDKIARSKENALYLKIKNTILHPFSKIKKKEKVEKKPKEKDRVYKKCPRCGTILKLPLPKKIGINHTKCPNCLNRLTVFSLKRRKPEKVKVEVIKKKRG